MLNRGSKRKTAKIRAPAIVPSIPAKLPNRTATTTITMRKIRGAELLNELCLNIGVSAAEAIAQHPAPIEAETQRDIAERNCTHESENREKVVCAGPHVIPQPGGSRQTAIRDRSTGRRIGNPPGIRFGRFRLTNTYDYFRSR